MKDLVIEDENLETDLLESIVLHTPDLSSLGLDIGHNDVGITGNPFDETLEVMLDDETDRDQATGTESEREDTSDRKFKHLLQFLRHEEFMVRNEHPSYINSYAQSFRSEPCIV